MGPTASGKSDLAEAMASELRFPLINADAFQVYRGLDIGTAKPTDRHNYHLLDIVDPWEEFGVGEWIRRVSDVLPQLFAEAGGAIVVGGSGYYIRALFEGYRDLADAPDPRRREELNRQSLEVLVAELQARDPSAAARVDLQNRVRVQRAVERLDLPTLDWSIPDCRKVKLARLPELERNRTRIFRRVEAMVELGWLDEIRGLILSGVQREHPGMRAHGYRAMWDVVHGERSLSEAIEATQVEVAQYAKRQRTWLRAEPNLITISAEDEGEALATALDLLWSEDGKIDQPARHVLEPGS